MAMKKKKTPQNEAEAVAAGALTKKKTFPKGLLH